MRKNEQSKFLFIGKKKNVPCLLFYKALVKIEFCLLRLYKKKTAFLSLPRKKASQEAFVAGHQFSFN